jgi:methylated-DNA-protein-cysteine methyltransferase-like protein
MKNDFFERVYVIVREIPHGRITSYSAISEYLTGTKRSARIVGWAMNASHIIYPPVPAHRVVNKDGLLTGFRHFATPTQMQELLEAEGIVVKNFQVQDFEKHFWDPREMDF